MTKVFRSRSEHVHVAFDIILLLFFLQVEFIYFQAFYLHHLGKTQN